MSRTLLRAQRFPSLAPEVTHSRTLQFRIGIHAIVAVVLFALTFVGAQYPAATGATSTAPVLQVAAFSLPGIAAAAPTLTVTKLEAAAVPLTVVSPAVRQETVLRASDGTQQAISALGERQAAGSNGGDRVAAARVQEQLPLFYRYDVQRGDTISGIASRFGIDSQYIIWNNVDIISDQHVLAAGEKLQVPSVEGILHQVKVGQTLTDIASLYEAKTSEIIGFGANGLSNNPNLLQEGSTIVVPGGKVIPKPAPAVRPAPPVIVAAAAPGGAPQQPAPSIASRPQSRSGFVWPVMNSVTSFYGPTHPLGIDIEAPYVPVSSARAGQVVFAGGDPCCSYGLNIVIRHDQGFETRYAHLSSIGVKLGQWVEVGQLIGVSGSSGRSTGPHLHFEVLLNGAIQNPMLYMP